MKHEHQRNIRIIDELITFCYKCGADNIMMNIAKDDTQYTLNVEAKVTDLSSETLTLVEKFLSAPRCHEMEEYYWELTGEDDTDCELGLVGMMIDDAEIFYEDSILRITLIRKIH